MGCTLGNDLVLRATTGHGHGFARQVFDAGELHALGRAHSSLDGTVRDGEVHGLLALGRDGERRDDQVHLVRQQVGDTCGVGGVHDLHLQTQVFGQQLGGFDIRAHRLHLVIDITVERCAKVDADTQLARGLDVGQFGHGGQAQGSGAGSQQGTAQDEGIGHGVVSRWLLKYKQKYK